MARNFTLILLWEQLTASLICDSTIPSLLAELDGVLDGVCGGRERWHTCCLACGLEAGNAAGPSH